jgi:hypothetical protein
MLCASVPVGDYPDFAVLQPSTGTLSPSSNALGNGSKCHDRYKLRRDLLNRHRGHDLLRYQTKYYSTDMACLHTFSLPMAELAWKWPILSRFEWVGAAWHPMLEPADLAGVLLYPLGGWGVGSAVWLLLLPALFLPLSIYSAVALIFRKQAGRRVMIAEQPTLALTAGTAVFACSVMLLVGFIKPSFTFRYMISFEPGILLGLVLIVRVAVANARITAYIGLITVSVCADAAWLASGASHLDTASAPLNIERASESIVRTGASTLLFEWDNSVARVMAPELLAAVGNFFFNRARIRIHVMPLKLSLDDDPNVRLLQSVSSSDTAMIWLYDLSARGTAAVRYPPRISQISSEYVCKDFGEGSIGSVACEPK